MKIVKFEGANMREAVAKVKAELGDQAVIVSTRQIKRGLLGGTACEISAAIDDGVDDAPRLPRHLSTSFADAPPPLPPPPAPSESDLERIVAPLRGELRSLRALVRASTNEARATAELRTELAALRKLVEELHAPPPPASSARGTLPPSEAKLTQSSNARIVMLVGPTGAGKTTTIAKLAARAALVEGRRVGMATLDNYRVGGIDQIRTFADLIGVPLRVAAPNELANAIVATDELTLIDTAGRSPRDAHAIRELAIALVELGAKIEVHLVVPAATSALAIDDLAARYAPLQPARLLFTKLDEIVDAPELARAPARLGLPITWIATGQAVPEDLEEPTTARVLEIAAAGLVDRTRSHIHAA